MTRFPRLRSRLTSIVLLALAGGAVFIALRPDAPGDLPEPSVQRLRERLPDADPALLTRTAETFGPVVEQVVDRHGIEGLRVLDTFGAEAFFCWKHAPDGFADLVDFCAKHPDRVPIAVAWKRAFPEWAQDHRLWVFFQVLYEVPDQSLDAVRRVPASVPLFARHWANGSGHRDVKETLCKHGERAWNLLLVADHHPYHDGLTDLAKAIREDDLILDVNEQFGPALALMFLPPRMYKGSRHFPLLILGGRAIPLSPSQAFPAVARHAWRRMGPEEAAAFLTTSYYPALELLDEGKSVEDLTEAIDLLRALPELTRELALDHTHTLRLLTEEHRGRRLGVDALKRCGPQAADLLYSAYASEPALKRPALVGLAGLGLQGLAVLERFRTYGPFFELLRRADRELMEGTPPLVLDVLARIAEAGGNAQQKIADYLRTPNLARSLAKDRLPPPPAEDVLSFVPGYTVYRTAMNYREGGLVTGGDLAWAAADAADTVFLVKGIITRAGKSVAVQLGQRTATRGVEMGSEAVLQSLKGTRRAGWEAWAKRGLDGAGAIKQVDELRKRFGDDTRRWSAEAREELRDLLARTPGLSAAAAREARRLARHLPLTTVLEQAAPVARTVGIELWRPGSGPLVEREVFRDDSWRKVRPKELNYYQESKGVGEFAIAMLETGGHLETARQAGGVSPLRGHGQETGPNGGLPARPIHGNAWQVGWFGVAVVLGLLALPPVRRSLFRRRTPRPGGHEPIRE
jgi:hypothetical protein